MIDTIRLALSALRDAGLPTGDGLRVLRVPDQPEVLLGIDADGRPHVLLAATQADPPVSGISTVEIDTRVLTVDGDDRTLVDVACVFESVAEVFDHFIAAIAERHRAGLDGSPEETVGHVLEAWRRFLTPEAAPPGRDRLAAVFGELSVLTDVVRHDPDRRVDCWVGPFSARHDLRRGAHAIEVKTTRAHTSRVVSIHGEDQLVEPDDGSLHLHLIRLEETPDAGASVTTLVEGLLTNGAPVEALFDALAAAGVPPAELASVDGVRFAVRERATFPVDDGMPRIVPGSFSNRTRPLGVVDLTYRIDLDHCLERVLGPEEELVVFQRLAIGAGT